MTALAVLVLLVLFSIALWGPHRVLGGLGGKRLLPLASHGRGVPPQESTSLLKRVRAKLCNPRGEPDVSLEFLVTDVAALLRAGAAPAEAWWEAGQVRVDAHGVPQLKALQHRLREPTVPEQRPQSQSGALARWRTRSLRQAPRTGGQQAAGIVAGCAVAQHLGAPLAPVLESIARSVVLAEQGRTDRETALAGPRSTARILGWLPLFGVLLASALGADPIGFLFGGPTGLATAVAGGLLMFVGRNWINHLIIHARRAGETV